MKTVKTNLAEKEVDSENHWLRKVGFLVWVLVAKHLVSFIVLILILWILLERAERLETIQFVECGLQRERTFREGYHTILTKA